MVSGLFPKHCKEKDMSNFPPMFTYQVSLQDPTQGHIRVSTHVAQTRTHAKRIAREEMCSDTGFPFDRMKDLVVSRLINLGPDSVDVELSS